MKLRAIVCMIIIHYFHTIQCQTDERLPMTLNKMGFGKAIMVNSMKSDHKQTEFMSMIKTSMDYDVRTALIKSMDEYLDLKPRVRKMFDKVVVIVDDIAAFNFKKLIKSSKDMIIQGVFVLSLRDDVEQLKAHLEKPENFIESYFYYMNTQDFELKDVIISNNVIAVNPNDRRNFDLGGMHIHTNALPWEPHLGMKNCDEDGYNCDLEGILADFMNFMGSKLNFTWNCQKEPSGSWGTVPLTGTADNGTWAGVLGSAINGDADIALSSWIAKPYRDKIMDYIETYNEYRVLLTSPQISDFDPELFFRPLTNDSWVGIGGIVLIFALVILPPIMLFHKHQNKEFNVEEKVSFKMAVTAMWYFMVLINAYYSGAMTMFFTTDLEIPLKTTQDVIRAWPDWKLLLRNGDDVFIYSFADNGDADYLAYWNRLKANREENEYGPISEGVEKIRSGKYVLSGTESNFQAYFNENPAERTKQTLLLLKEKLYYKSCMMLRKRWPVTPVMSNIMIRMREFGIINNVVRFWFRRPVEEPSKGLTDVTILTLAQISMIFMIMFFALCCTCAVLIFEILVFKQFKTFKCSSNIDK